jgi:hypothetical protein
MYVYQMNFDFISFGVINHCRRRRFRHHRCRVEAMAAVPVPASALFLDPQSFLGAPPDIRTERRFLFNLFLFCFDFLIILFKIWKREQDSLKLQNYYKGYHNKKNSSRC